MRTFFLIFIFVTTCDCANAQSITINRERKNGEYILWATNNMPCPTSIVAQADTLNMEFRRFIPQGGKRLLAKIPESSINTFSEMDEMLEYRLVIGNPKAVHDDSYQYSLPFPVGKSYELMQGNDGSFTHNTPRSRYAFDFQMPEGSIVTAARGGMVAFVEERFEAGGNDEQLLNKGNQIVVCHDDGTVAAYAHIKKDGAIAKIGDRVFAGQAIAFSGNTGYTTGPHLHFVVLIGDKSIPIQFMGIKGPLFQGHYYAHYNIY